MRNKKGVYNIFTLFGVFFLTMIAISIISVNNGLNVDAIQNLTWDKDGSIKNMTLSNNIIVSITGGFVDFIGDSTFKITKEAVKWTKNHPTIDPKILIYAIILILLTPLIWPMFLIIVSLILIIREWWMNKKERENNQPKKEVRP